jgi:hypothetical protein
LPITRLLIANAAIIDDAEQRCPKQRVSSNVTHSSGAWSDHVFRSTLPAEIASWDIRLIYCAQGVNRPWVGQKGDEILVFRLRYGIIIKSKRSRVAGQATRRQESWRIPSCISRSVIYSWIKVSKRRYAKTKKGQFYEWNLSVMFAYLFKKCQLLVFQVKFLSASTCYLQSGNATIRPLGGSLNTLYRS